MRILARPAWRTRAVNPYNALLADGLQEAGESVDEFTPTRLLFGRYDIIHVHWPETFASYGLAPLSWLRAVIMLMALAWRRRHGARVVWTVHNLKPHTVRHNRLLDWFYRRFVPLVDAHIHLSESGREAAVERFPGLSNLPSGVVPIGHYRDAYPAPPKKTPARTALGLSEKDSVLLFVGQIKAYKNVPHLIDTFRSLKRSSTTLLVAGLPETTRLEEDVRRIADRDPTVRLDLRLIDDGGIVNYLAASDLVVLPFTTIWNSASALLALSFDRPVVVPARGALIDLTHQVGEAWVFAYPGDLTPKVLNDAINWAHQTRDARAPLDAFDWQTIARKTKDVYRAAARRI